MIGENTFREAKDFACLEVDLIRVKGKTEPVRIYTLIGDPELNRTEAFQELSRQHSEMLRAYWGQNWEKALNLMEDCLKLDTPKTRLRVLYEVYRSRIETYRTQPPPPDWNGVYTAQAK